MTVRTLLIVGALAFFGLLATAFGTTVLLLGDGSGGARTVGLTNRQGMLSQKVAKEALAYARSPKPEGLIALRNTMQVFSVTQRALRFGGTAPVDLEATRFEDVAGASDPELSQLLRTASDDWETMVDAIERLVVAAQSRTDALTQVELKNPRLMRKMEQVSRILARGEKTGPLKQAGLQGIIAERTVKEALLFDTAPSLARRDQLLASIAAFERGHTGLRRRAPNGLRERAANAVTERLDEAKWLWIDQAEALNRLANNDGGYHDTVQTINETNPKLLQTLSAAAVRADWVAERNVRQLQAIQLSVLAVGVLLAIAAMFLALRIGSSLRRLRNTADAISRGHVDDPVTATGVGEIRDLARSFERMRLSLRKAMELLDRPHRQSGRTTTSGRTHHP